MESLHFHLLDEWPWTSSLNFPEHKFPLLQYREDTELPDRVGGKIKWDYVYEMAWYIEYLNTCPSDFIWTVCNATEVKKVGRG